MPRCRGRVQAGHPSRRRACSASMRAASDWFSSCSCWLASASCPASAVDLTSSCTPPARQGRLRQVCALPPSRALKSRAACGAHLLQRCLLLLDLLDLRVVLIRHRLLPREPLLNRLQLCLCRLQGGTQLPGLLLLGRLLLRWGRGGSRLSVRSTNQDSSARAPTPACAGWGMPRTCTSLSCRSSLLFSSCRARMSPSVS